MSAYNFFVCGPKFTIFFSPNVGGVVVDHILFRFSICGSITEIFAMEVDSCLKSRRILDVFCPPKFQGQAFPKNSAELNTPAKSFVTLPPLVTKLQALTP